jgi:hypothetical protein
MIGVIAALVDSNPTNIFRRALSFRISILPGFSMLGIGFTENFFPQTTARLRCAASQRANYDFSLGAAIASDKPPRPSVSPDSNKTNGGQSTEVVASDINSIGHADLFNRLAVKWRPSVHAFGRRAF